MRILMVIPGLDKRLGGTTTLSIGFFNHLSNLLEVSLATLYLNEEENSSIERHFFDSDSIHIFKSELSFYKYSQKFKSFLRNNIGSFDLVHIHGLWHGASFITASIALKARVPYIISPHGMLEPDAFARSGWKKRLFWNLFYKKAFKKASAIHCTALSEVKNTLRFDPNAAVFHIPNGISLPDILPTTKKENQILFMGRLHEKKGVDLLVRAITAFPELKLKIAGTGKSSYEDYLKKLANEIDLNNQIEFIGFVEGDQKEELYQKSLFCAIPSYSEGLPLVALESLANATPLLITKTSNVPEVSEFNCGIELEENSVEAIKAGISKMLMSDLKWMGANARKVAEQKFHWPKVAEEMFNEYKKILG